MRCDIVVPVYDNLALTRRCLDAVILHKSIAMGRLVIVYDCGPERELLPLLRGYRDDHANCILIENEQNRGFVSAANRGLLLCDSDAVILNADTCVTAGWLDALISAAAERPDIAALSPLSNNGFLCSVPHYQHSTPESLFDGVDLALHQLPVFTEMPTAVGFCMWMSGQARKTVGVFDRKFSPGYQEENDWCQRARAAGFVVGRANRSFVFHKGGASFGERGRQLDMLHLRRLVRRYPGYLAENRAFDRSRNAQCAALHVAERLRLAAKGWVPA